ncbi:MAG TPA: hypothetical protein VKA74_04105, partial [Myxococcota bacterium]|nr:hypothetical protein [Myxococcota bacterium]
MTTNVIVLSQDPGLRSRTAELMRSEGWEAMDFGDGRSAFLWACGCSRIRDLEALIVDEAIGPSEAIALQRRLSMLCPGLRTVLLRPDGSGSKAHRKGHGAAKAARETGLASADRVSVLRAGALASELPKLLSRCDRSGSGLTRAKEGSSREASPRGRTTRGEPSPQPARPHPIGQPEPPPVPCMPPRAMRFVRSGLLRLRRPEDREPHG